MSFTITGADFLGGSHLEAQLVKAFEQWAETDVNDHFYDEFHDVKWKYLRETRRKNPQAPIRNAGNPRDIIDYGALYESGRDNFRLGMSSAGATADWLWDARGDSGYPYAVDVHEGDGTSAGFPRKWTDDVRIPQKFEASTVRSALISRLQAALAAK